MIAGGWLCQHYERPDIELAACLLTNVTSGRGIHEWCPLWASILSYARQCVVVFTPQPIVTPRGVCGLDTPASELARDGRH